MCHMILFIHDSRFASLKSIQIIKASAFDQIDRIINKVYNVQSL